MTQKLPLVYADPNLRPDHFAKLSGEMKKLFLATYPESPRHQPEILEMPEGDAENVRLERLVAERDARIANLEAALALAIRIVPNAVLVGSTP